jgi:hypothetical protein
MFTIIAANALLVWFVWGVLFGSRVDAWYLDNGMVARDGVVRTSPSKTRVLKTHGRPSETRTTGHRFPNRGRSGYDHRGLGRTICK